MLDLRVNVPPGQPPLQTPGTDKCRGSRLNSPQQAQHSPTNRWSCGQEVDNTWPGLPRHWRLLLPAPIVVMVVVIVVVVTPVIPVAKCQVEQCYADVAKGLATRAKTHDFF